MEANILNPSANSDLNPTYGYTEGLPATLSAWQARSGERYARRMLARGRIYDLAWEKILASSADKLRQWEQQYEQGFFTYADWERSRYFSGCFASPLQFSPADNDQWNVKGQFVELPNLVMYQYPTNWTRDAIFLEEKDDFGAQLVKTSGDWYAAAGASRHGGTALQSAAANDTAEWQYFGYGFRVWQIKNTLLGIVEVSLDGVVLGTYDGYVAVGTDSAAVFTKSDVRLGLHRVKLRNTGTKNGASGGILCEADAIEVMR